jgi:hypothetical protein
MGWLASLPGCILFSAITGGVALLNHRLMAENPPGFGKDERIEMLRKAGLQYNPEYLN